MTELIGKGRLSTTARLALLSTLLLFLTNLAVLALLYGQLRDDAIQQLRQAVTAEADDFIAIHREGGDRALADAVADLRSDRDPTFVFRLYGPSAGTVGAIGTTPSQISPEPVTFAIAAFGGAIDGKPRDTAYSVRRLGKGWLLSGRLFDDRQQMQHTLERALIVSILLAVCLGLISAAVIVYYVNHRLRGIVAVVDDVTAGNLSRRAPVVSGGDSFDDLAARVNMMLDRVERLLDELRLLTDSFAHDLRSPLTRLRAKVERAAVQAEGAEGEAAMESALAETDVVLRMLATLLQIGRAGALEGRDRLEWLSPSDVLEGVADLYEPLMQDQGRVLTLEIESGLPKLRLHHSLLSQALSNLIDNALRYGGTRIVLGAERREDGLIVSVVDDGPGIAPHDRAEALRRFGRLDAARAHPGAGLGLALVNAVAALHGGRMALADASPGLSVQLFLPLA